VPNKITSGVKKDMQKKINKTEREFIQEIRKRKLNPREISGLISKLQKIKPHKYPTKRIDFPDNHVKFAVFSDAHMGHRCYRPDILSKLIKDGTKQGVEFYLNVGDTIEGMSGRDGHIYELDYIGATAQMDYFATQFQKFRNKNVYSIEADSSHGGWFKSKGNAGLDIGTELDKRSRRYKFIGYDEQDLKLDNGLKIRLRHPGGGTAYAISYKAQKYIESISGGKKPNMLFQGHFHKAMYFFYRNIHSFDAGCLQEQSPFMKKVGTPAHLGYWILDVNMFKQKNKGVERVDSQFVPFYE